ncbi:MAG TPA: methyltransferase domain-containing protein [Chitinophagaceae bacterium]|nr:methyltransferase domain-containing protein [Chitinophagaceae bacterium]
MNEPLTLDDAYWSGLYRQQQTRWDIGQASTPLKEYIDKLANKDLRILIPGCGNAWEADYLLAKKFTNLTILDISEELVKKLSEKFRGKPIRILHQDFFTHDEKYDLILEQTFFCALDPSLRAAYVKKMFSLLKPGGKLAGVLFDRAFEDGPPFGGNRREYERLFREQFSKLKMEPCYNSIPPRRDTELFFIAEKTS